MEPLFTGLYLVGLHQKMLETCQSVETFMEIPFNFVIPPKQSNKSLLRIQQFFVTSQN